VKRGRAGWLAGGALLVALGLSAAGGAFRPHPRVPFGGVTLVDQRGERFTLEAFHGKRVLLAFATAADGAAGACASVSGKFAYLQHRIDPRRVHLLQVSADPLRDSAPGVLPAYGRLYGIDARRWSVAAGAAGDVAAGGRALVDAAQRAGISDVFGAAVAVIDESGRFRGVLDAGSLSPGALVRAALRR
jgi:cytochrome oxidase Cu insertion factor (SCO1/SenC/PrrC family)